MVENILIIGELGKLAVNDYNKFSVICMESYNHDYLAWGTIMIDKNEDDVRTFADMMATKVAEFNYYEEGGEKLISGTEYLVYNSKGRHTHTGQIKENIIH